MTVPVQPTPFTNPGVLRYSGHMDSSNPVSFDNSYARLGEQFYTPQLPVPVARPGLIRVNHELARKLGFDPDWLESERGVEFLAGNFIAEGSEPLAAVYAGHQFGGWNPQLGDGRAILLGEVVGRDGIRYDIQLKGSGRTPYSRGGDGRAPLGPVLREYVVSEAMAAMGVPTSRTLGAVSSGEWVMREGRLPGAVLTRVAQSHIRIGTLQFFAARGNVGALRTLVDHVIQRHYPQAAETEDPVRTMLDGVIARQAALVARWQSLGFIHGVMNTDNMLLSGETIDYGPCAFMDDFDIGRVLSSIDHGGRYAYGNQPYIAHWNLSVLAQALLPLLDGDADKALASGQAAIDAFPALYQSAYTDIMRKKLGFATTSDGDAALVQELLQLMQTEKTDFTLAFRRLSDLAGEGTAASGSVAALFEFPDAYTPWLEGWRKRLAAEQRDAGERQRAMYAVNPVYIPRNHLVEEAIAAAQKYGDFEPFHRLVEVLQNPFDYDPEQAVYATPPRPEQVVTQTFCGT